MPHPSNPNLPGLVADVRELSKRAHAADRGSLVAWRDLAAMLLAGTVASDGSTPRLIVRGTDRTSGAIGNGSDLRTPLRLRNGAFLRLTMSLTLRHQRLIVEQSSIQYQLDEDGDRWVFRYDYRRRPTDHYAAAHIQVRGHLAESNASDRALERIHFPTNRVSLEGVIRLLAEDFNVPCCWPQPVWRGVLAASERLFLDHATTPLSGPEA